MIESGRVFIHLHTPFTTWVGSTIGYGEVGVIHSGFRDGVGTSRGGVMKMAYVCVVSSRPFFDCCAWGILCVSLSGFDGFC